MDLHQWNRPYDQIITSTNQIYIQQNMISYNTIHSFVIIYRVSGPELNNDLFVGVSMQSSLGLVEQKYVVGISEKLEIRL